MLEAVLLAKLEEEVVALETKVYIFVIDVLISEERGFVAFGIRLRHDVINKKFPPLQD